MNSRFPAAKAEDAEFGRRDLAEEIHATGSFFDNNQLVPVLGSDLPGSSAGWKATGWKATGRKATGRAAVQYRISRVAEFSRA
jgi:hypothetical protein